MKGEEKNIMTSIFITGTVLLTSIGFKVIMIGKLRLLKKHFTILKWML